MRKRVDIYTRLSDEDRYKRSKTDDSESIANQKSMLIKYAMSKDWEIHQIYSDDDYSGADINRPQFQQMLKDCEEGKVDIVLCKTQSRFSRDMEVIEKYIHNKFIEWGVRFVSIVDNADTEVKGNKKARQINGLINEWYLEDLSDNIRTSLKNRREDGLYLGSFAPYGYLKDPSDKNKLIVDPIASEVVKKIFSLYKSGVGYFKIAKQLNEEGIKTPTNYKKETGSKYVCKTAKFWTKTKWSQDTIARLLRNEVYIGNLVQGVRGYVSYKNHRTYVKPKDEWCRVCGTHEPIIDIETWNYCQSKFKTRSKVSRTTGSVYMLSCKVYCMECKSVFTRNLYHTKDGKTPYLKCKGRKLAGRECDNISSIRCDILEKIILDEINKQLNKYHCISEMDKIYVLQKKALENKNLISKRDSLETEKENLTIKVEKKNDYYQKLYEDKLEGIVTQEEFSMLRERYSKEIEECKQRISIINSELNNIRVKENSVVSTKKIFDKYKHIDVLTKDIIDEFIDYILIGKLDKEKNNREIRIEYKTVKL